ncbi:hypothetical protein SLS63_013347 [Diaporthe eres]|uniref:Cytochrome P450 n=1 Tax=Diaporthe eres TaxID=83184 RepID=A0ABR1NNR4_DIAER
MSFNDPKLEIDLSECGQKLLVLILVLLSLPAVYNVYFHPLARVPGPFLAKISDLWHAYHVSTGTRHILLGELHKTYGPLIRLGPNTVSVNTDDGLQKVFSATSPIDKSPFYKAFAPGFDSSFAAVGQAFKEKKSILSHAFAQKKLDAMETTFMEHTRKLCNVIATREEVELDDCLSALTIDILSHDQQRLGACGEIRIIGGDTLAMANITEDDQDFITCVYNSQLPGAGSDTTSTALLTTLWHLLRHNKAYERVTKEVRLAFGCIDDITYQEAQHLPYLRAVIEESLRIFPPNSGFIPRQVLASEQPFVLHDVALPPGVYRALITEFDMQFRDPQKEFERGYAPTDSFVLLRPRVNIIARRSRV